MSEDNDAFSFEGKNLDNLLKALKDNMKRVRVGILGGKAARTGGTPNNATIGAFHEYGTSKTPQRSFLRVPIAEHLQERLTKAGAFTKEELQEVAKTKSLLPWLKKIGIVAEKIVSDAFATKGFGKWKNHAPGYENNTGQVLVDTQQLRNSITSEVK
jgi:hypothetical protein